MSPQTVPAQLVALDEVAARLGTLPEVVAGRLPARVKIQPDWQGRPSIPTEAAARLVDKLETERREQADKQVRYDAWQQDREALRQYARQEAYTKALNDAHAQETAEASAGFVYLGGQIGPSPRARQIAQQAANEAGRNFDSRHPLVPLEEWET
jgi:hypothetical protein